MRAPLGGLYASWHADRKIRVCSLKIRQFVLTLKRKRSAYGLNVAFENQLIKLL
jgi:hypothetical protein